MAQSGKGKKKSPEWDKEHKYHEPHGNEEALSPIPHARNELIFFVKHPRDAFLIEPPPGSLDFERSTETTDAEPSSKASVEVTQTKPVTTRALLEVLPANFRELLAGVDLKDIKAIPALRFSGMEGWDHSLFRVKALDLKVVEVYENFYNVPRTSTEQGEGLPLGEDILLRHVYPNWHNASAPHVTIGPHGPGGPPRPVHKDKVIGLEFVLSDKLNEAKSNTTPKAIVYILDTLPTEDRIRDALQDFPGLAPTFQRILPAVPADWTPVAVGPYSDAYKTEKATYIYSPEMDINLLMYDVVHHYAPGAHDYDSSDHGLFIAGIVHSMAPEVELYVIQVMGDAGVGTIFDFAHGFSKVAVIHQTLHPGAPAVVNCSFSLSIPINGHEDSKKKNTLETFRETHPGFEDQLKDLLEAIDEILSKNALIVAAAGNDSPNPAPADSSGTAQRAAGPASPIAAASAKETRYPAQFDSIIGVGALDRARKELARYSNKADQPSSQGIYAFGGDYDHKQHANVRIENDYELEEGVISIFTGNPRDLIPGQTDAVALGDQALGYAEWEGTSFAAPIVSACIALLWSANAGDRDSARNAIYTECESVTRVNKSGKTEDTHKLGSVYQGHKQPSSS
jgi:hypothetical protein